MTLALPLQSVSVDGWTAYDHPHPPADDLGNIWVWQTIEGWFGGLAPRGDPVPRPLLDGDFDGVAPFGGRTVELSGMLVAPTRQALQQGMDRLARVLATQVRRSALTVTEGVVPLTRTVTVRLGGPTLISRVDRLTAKWSLSLYAPDPARYSTDRHVVTLTPYVPGVGRTYNLVPNRVYGPPGATGIANVGNAGDRSTPLTVTFYGPSTNPELRIVGGDTVHLLMTLADSTTSVVVDCGQRTVLMGGASRRQYLTADSRWLYIPPGFTQLFYSTDSPADTGRCDVTWQDAWS